MKLIRSDTPPGYQARMCADPRTLRATRQRRAMTVAQLAGQLDRPASYISSVENEKSWITGDDLAACAAILNVTVELLTTSMPEQKAEGAHLRSGAVSKLVHGQLVQHANYAGWMLNRLHEHTAAEAVHPRHLPDVDTDLGTDPGAVAGLVRAQWNLHGSVADIAGLVEGAGVMILPMPANRARVDALSVRANGPVCAVILLNQSIPSDRQWHALAHELGHLVIDQHRRVPVHHRVQEEQAERFAAEFLATRTAIDPVRPEAAERFLQALSVSRYSAVDISRITMTRPSELQNVFGELWPFSRVRPALTVVRGMPQ